MMINLEKALTDTDGRKCFPFTIKSRRVEADSKVTNCLYTGWIMAVSKEEAFGKVVIIGSRVYDPAKGWHSTYAELILHTFEILDDVDKVNTNVNFIQR